MPIYEYQCQSCEHQFEALQKIADAPLVDCPVCGKPELKKLVTAAAFKLTGTGWYETDFKNSGKPAAKSADGKGESGATAKTDAATAKPAAASADKDASA